MRLNKYIALAGVASRRKADELTEAGKVRINGTVMREKGYDVKSADVVEGEGRTILPAAKSLYLMLNKPKGFITSLSDEKNRPTVMDLVTDIEERVFPVGRLDYNTSGLLLLTNDGELAYQLTHPKHQVEKTYRARVAGVLSSERQARLRKGIDIGGYITAPAVVAVVKQMDRSAIVEITIREGKNRQIRKMFAAVGNKVIDLERIAIGEIFLRHLMPGHYRKLTPREIEYLRGL